MLFHLLYAFRHQVTALNVIRYITFRTAVASLTALFLVLALGPWAIERLRRLQVGQPIREEGPQAHKAKAGTPTLGGAPPLPPPPPPPPPLGAPPHPHLS